MSSSDFHSLDDLKRILSYNESLSIWWYLSGFGTQCLKNFGGRDEQYFARMADVQGILKQFSAGTLKGRPSDHLGLKAAEKHFLDTGNISRTETPICLWRNGEFTEDGKNFIAVHGGTIEAMLTKPEPPAPLIFDELKILKNDGMIAATRAYRTRTGAGLRAALFLTQEAQAFLADTQPKKKETKRTTVSCGLSDCENCRSFDFDDRNGI